MTKLNMIGSVLKAAKRAAVAYYRLTGKPLGITGEMGEYFAAKHLGLKLAEARTPGFDAYGKDGRLVQIKSRSIPRSKGKGKGLSGQRTGSIQLNREWNSVVLVLMDEFFEPFAIYEADRKSIEKALVKPGSKARNERGALSVTKFISIAAEVWSKTG